MNLHISKKRKEQLKRTLRATGNALKETGKYAWKETKEAGRSLMRNSRPMAKGFGKTAEMIEESFAMPKRVEQLPQGGVIVRQPINPKAFYPRPMPLRRRRNPFENI